MHCLVYRTSRSLRTQPHPRPTTVRATQGAFGHEIHSLLLLNNRGGCATKSNCNGERASAQRSKRELHIAVPKGASTPAHTTYCYERCVTTVHIAYCCSISRGVLQVIVMVRARARSAPSSHSTTRYPRALPRLLTQLTGKRGV